MKTYNITDYKTIAIIQTAFLGDIALTFPLLQNIKNMHPDVKLILVTTQVAHSLALTSKVVDEVIVFDKRAEHKGLKGIKKIAKQLSDINVDCIISPHRSFRSTLTMRLASPKLSIGFSKNSLCFFYKERVLYKDHLHEIERNNELLTPFFEYKHRSKHTDIELLFKDTDQYYVDNLKKQIEIIDKKYVIIAPSSVWNTKKWTESGFIHLSQKIKAKGLEVLVTGSKADEELCQRIATASAGISIAGRTSIPQSMLLMKDANIVITNDSAPTHFAGLVHSPVITIYGPTVPEFGFAPFQDNGMIIQNEHLKCRPCAIHGTKKCPLGTLECMNSISSDDILVKIEQFL